MPRAHAAAPRLIISCKVSLLAALVILMATAGLLATSTATLTNTLRRYDYYTNGDHHFYHSKHTHSQQQQPFGRSSRNEESWASISSVRVGGGAGAGKRRRDAGGNAASAAAAVSRAFFGVNPWLPAADVQEAVAASLQCPFDGGGQGRGGGSTGCPPPCAKPDKAPAVAAATERTAADHDDRSTQCLHYLQESHKEEVCSMPSERRHSALQSLHLRHCCEHSVAWALPEEAFRAGAGAGAASTCRHLLHDLLLLDELASRISCSHADLLTRYDCSQNYSIVHNCKDCKEAYRRWVCASLVPRYRRTRANGARVRVKPCPNVCEDVEQQCPYLLPDQTVTPADAAHPTPQYAGEPTFLCRDPNIPDLATIERERRTSEAAPDAPRRPPGTTSLMHTPTTDWSDEEEACCYAHRGCGGTAICEHCPGRPHPSFAHATAGAASAPLPSFLLLLLPAVLALLPLLPLGRRTGPIQCSAVRCCQYFSNDNRTQS